MSPRVPRYDNRVATTPLGRPSVPAAAFIPPDPVEGVDLREVAAIATNMYEREKAQAEKVRTLDFRAKLAAARSALLYDPQKGALNRKGEASFNLPGEVADEWRKVVSRTEQDMGSITRDQALMFQAIGTEYGMELDDAVRRHSAREYEEFHTTRAESLVQTELAFGLANFTDASAREIAVARARAIRAETGRWAGKPPEVIAAQTSLEISAFHASVINRQVAAGMDPVEYFESVKGELVGNHLVNAEQAVNEFTTMAKGQRLADPIIGTPGITRRDAFERARQITDPRIREEVEQRLDVEFRRRDAAVAEEQDQYFTAAYDIVERGGTIPAHIRARLTPKHREDLAQRQRQLAGRGGGRAETDWATYYALRAIAADPAEQEQFMAMNLLEVRSSLADTEFKQMVDLQGKMRQGGDDEEVRGFISEEEAVNNAIELSGMFDNAKAGGIKGKRLVRFKQLVNRRIISEKGSSGRKSIPADKVQLIVAQMLRRVASSPWILDADIPSSR